MRFVAAAVVLVAVVSAALFWSLSPTARVEVAAVGAGDIVVGKQIYAENCAACHGANLEGQADWRSPGDDGKLPAPPHDETGHTWHHSDQVLFKYTKLGGSALLAEQGIDFESGMPAFGDHLTDQEINDVLAFIKSTWPEQIRAAQVERTNAEKQ